MQRQAALKSSCLSPQLIHHVPRLCIPSRERSLVGRGVYRKTMPWRLVSRTCVSPLMAASYDPGVIREVYEPEKEKSLWAKAMEWGTKAVVLMGMALAVALACPGLCEAAKSGGRMGGRAFSSSRSQSYSRPSSSSHSPFKSSSKSWSSNRMVTGSSRPVGLSAFFFPSFGMGYGMGSGFGGGIINLAVYGFMFAVLIQFLQNMFGGYDEDDYRMSFGEGNVSVARVQVGLLGLARGLQRDLDRVARSADTSTPRGLQYVLQETILALNRNPDYCVYGAAQSKSTSNPDAAENKFNELSLQERSKIQQETLSNVGGRSGSSRLTGSTADGTNELIVVTILVAVEGKLNIRKVKSREELQTALNRLGSVREDQLMAVEVLWVPQDENDSYTSEQLLEEYPNMYTL